ncbi:threonine/serine exporter family protein [Bombilactobacillus bombi]|uniref:threonine/serine ThrE exporter family protein n=1 Tax=Bombilactobacillus bombi TaxID=1303590 RepID=UPI0015E5A7D4|nr:threonine/serine exporter family protein [Bombilactobacillus bombi]MBA1434391.1 threonine/serine exporter family protein [Bombilactobacillus bombi]
MTEDRAKPQFHLSKKHHMTIHWKDYITDDNISATEASINERSGVVGRVGIMLLSCGTGAWRVRDAMNTVARALNLTCSAEVGLLTISYTCFSQNLSHSQVLTLPKSGVNTDKLSQMENFVNNFNLECRHLTIRQIHLQLDKIQHRPGHYSAGQAALAAAIACSAFVFLLGGGLVEMLCCFVGAGMGNLIRKEMTNRSITLLADISVSVAVACLAYLGCFKLLEVFFGISLQHEAGYIGAMLFVIPGFPFITSMLDMSKLDMKSGLERLAYALTIIITATLVGWLVALTVHLRPKNFLPLNLSPLLMLLLRLPASFFGVYGFSIMFNSPRKMAFWAGILGALGNTLRLELVDLTHIPAGAAAFAGAFLAGILASAVNKKHGYPRISLTVPAIVIMIPGLYIYRGVYSIGINAIGVGALWLSKAAMIIMFIPLGLFVARVLLDKKWRYCD